MSEEQQEVTTQQEPEAPAVEAAQPSTPEWTPNFTYKFMGEEREIDPALRAAIKDAETEKKIRDYAERAEALPLYKNRYGELEGKYKDLEGKWTSREQQLSKMASFYQKNDMDMFFKTLGVPEDKLVQHVIQLMKFKQLPEEQKRLYNENREKAERESHLEQQLAESNARLDQEAVLARTFQLDNELGRGEVKQVAETYDQLYGQGAFKNEVIKIGQYEALMNNRDMPANEAVMAVVGKAKPIIERISTQQQSHKPSVIPNNIKGNPAAPAKKGFTSIADLRAAANQGE